MKWGQILLLVTSFCRGGGNSHVQLFQLIHAIYVHIRAHFNFFHVGRNFYCAWLSIGEQCTAMQRMTLIKIMTLAFQPRMVEALRTSRTIGNTTPKVARQCLYLCTLPLPSPHVCGCNVRVECHLCACNQQRTFNISTLTSYI